MPPLPINHQAPAIQGLSIPDEFYWVLTENPPLAGMRLPNPATPWETLHSKGFRWIACLCSDQPMYDPAPIEFLVTLELSDLVENPLPEDPEMEEKAISLIASSIVNKLENGEGGIVHCAGGRGRTGTVLGAALKKLDYPVDEILTFLNDVHVARNKPGWPEASWQRSLVERAN